MKELSYWEEQTWLGNIDHAIVGSGIVGISCALELRRKYPDSKIVVFERGLLPNGASTKNAGFACFGSVSEILDDLKTHTEQEVIELVKSRLEGLDLLRDTLGDEAMDFQLHGGYEVFRSEDKELFETCVSKLNYVNQLLEPVFSVKSLKKKENEPFSLKNDTFLFKNTQNQLIFNQFEGQINTGMMMSALLRKAQKAGINITNNVEIESFEGQNGQILVKTAQFRPFEVKNLFIATNGFANQLIKEDLKPARAQVVITKPISGLHIVGTFHLDKGFYYFRNIHNRILLGGGRNLDFEGEQTSELGTTELIQNRLEELLRTTILPNTAFEIDSCWSGIMGIGPKKKPIVKMVQPGVYCAVRLGGMGVALGSSVGKQLANLVES